MSNPEPGASKAEISVVAKPLLVESITIESITITVVDPFRQGADLTDLQRSIAEVGLLHPITVDRAHRLLAGRRRLEACKALGWITIPANVVTLDELHSTLVTLEENLTQLPLTELARALQLARQKEIYEALNPETRSARTKGGPGRGKKTNDTVSLVFADKTAKALGTSRRTVERSVKLGKKLDPKAAELIADHPVANRRAELVQLAEKSSEEQRKTAQLLHDGKAKSVKGAIRKAKFTMAKALPKSEHFEVKQGNFVATLGAIKSGAASLVIADPPWGRNFTRYQALTEGIAKALRPGGTAAIMIGQDYLPHVLDAVRQHLTYRWTLAVLRPHRMHQAWQARIMSGWTPMVLATQGTEPPKGFESDVIKDSEGRDIRGTWEKDEGTFIELIERFTLAGELVVDPFCGSGASGAAALRLGRRWLGGDLDQSRVTYTATRLAEVPWATVEPKEHAGGLLDRWEETR